MTTRSITGTVCAVIYLIAVVLLIRAAFDFAGAVREPWIWWLMAATMPSSLPVWLGIWALIHGANLGCFAVFFFCCALTNVWLVKLIIERRRRKRGVAG